jgi:hypothetical protein
MTDSVQPNRALEQELFDEWPDALRALFDGTALADKTGFTASLVTVDANSHVRTSLLGIGELYAPDSRTVCIALWPQARATRALTQSRRAALTFVFDDAFYQVQLEFEALSAADDVSGDAGLAYFVGSIDTGEAQRVRYARLTGGITFELQADREAVLERWEQQVESLKRAAQTAAGR